jgi:hypothetical protein
MRRRAVSYGMIGAALCFPSGVSAARFIPDCAGSVEIAHAKVVRVEHNGA